MSLIQALKPAKTDVDFSHRPAADLAELRKYTNGNRELEREILDLFSSGMPVHFDTLMGDCTGVTPVSADEWHLAIHTIKSSAVTIGAWDAAKICIAILNMPFDQRTAKHCREVHKLGESLDAVYRQIPLLIQSL
jgi:hypothetical protein